MNTKPARSKQPEISELLVSYRVHVPPSRCRFDFHIRVTIDEFATDWFLVGDSFGINAERNNQH